MTVRLAKLGGTDWNNEQLTDDDLNDTLNRGTIQYFTGSTTASTTGNTTYTRLINVSIPANRINSVVIVIVNCKVACGKVSSSEETKPSMDFRAGETGSVTSKYELDPIWEEPVGGPQVSQARFAIMWVYEPSASEKTNGFDIDVYFKNIENGTGGESGYDSYWILGI